MTIFDMKALNDLVRFHLMQDVIYRLSQLAAASVTVIIGKWLNQINLYLKALSCNFSIKKMVIKRNEVSEFDMS
jgi:hypothetical protein